MNNFVVLLFFHNTSGEQIGLGPRTGFIYVWTVQDTGWSRLLKEIFRGEESTGSCGRRYDFRKCESLLHRNRIFKEKRFVLNILDE